MIVNPREVPFAKVVPNGKKTKITIIPARQPTTLFVKLKEVAIEGITKETMLNVIIAGRGR